ncbi:MAG: polysaccharide deacetylase family protein [Sphingobacteriaceae bacterium]|nr:polysaccharide deacetylase family protein [Sphingobacteriaceae bacterium]
MQPKAFLKKIYKGAIWDVKTEQKEIYLSFDDGPVPIITDWVLDELKKYQAKATFFCVGNNILKYPKIYERILAEGHTVGNHTMHHVKGFKLSQADYLKEIEACHALIKNPLFRPPYGQLKPSQFKMLKNKGYKVVFWDVISYDYEQINAQKCLQNAINNTVKGSIVLFHDSVKAEKNLRYVLPLYLKHFANLQFSFKSLNHV